MNDYIRNDQGRIKEVVENNNKALNDFKEKITELSFEQRSAPSSKTTTRKR